MSVNDLKPHCLKFCFILILSFSVFISIQRRQFEQVKVAVSIILNVLKAVFGGHDLEEVAQTAKENLIAIKDELRNNQTKRWQAIGTLKHVLSLVKLPWELKKHAIKLYSLQFVSSVCLSSLNLSFSTKKENVDIYIYIYFSCGYSLTFQVVKMVIVYAPEPEHRKKILCCAKRSGFRVLADIPNSQRFDILKALITNTDSSSMIAIFIDLARKEMHTAICSSRSIVKDAPPIDNKSFLDTSFWNTGILELVELVQRPPQGGPPSLPEQSDAKNLALLYNGIMYYDLRVLSALDLYRFVLMTESAEKTNYTRVLSRNSLLKAYNEWLLPLRTLVTGIMAESKSDYD
ncbi:hypothetical protein GYH30_039699 [Glycine max]|uniref:Uncharacterized protein n=1 Tax=Glycine max TaxID=3847 RepID=K7M681_SOYBN|nr:hypothetical protein GYH30_039699 [Glycine max]